MTPLILFLYGLALIGDLCVLGIAALIGLYVYGWIVGDGKS